MGQFILDLANHRIHEFTYALILLTAGVGLTAQFRRPRENIAGQLIAVAVLGVTLLAFASAGYQDGQSRVIELFGKLALFATILHPAIYNFLSSFSVSRARDFFRSFSFSRINRAMLALVIIATIPLSMFAYTQIGLQAGTIEEEHEDGEMVEESAGSMQESGANEREMEMRVYDFSGLGLLDNINRIVFNPAVDNEEIHQEHVDEGHFGMMAGISFTIIAIGLLASLRPRGWRLAAWIAGILPILLGLASVVYPNDSSSLGLFWGLAAIIWGVAFVVAAELPRYRELKKAQTP